MTNPATQETTPNSLTVETSIVNLKELTNEDYVVLMNSLFGKVPNGSHSKRFNMVTREALLDSIYNEESSEGVPFIGILQANIDCDRVPEQHRNLVVIFVPQAVESYGKNALVKSHLVSLASNIFCYDIDFEKNVHLLNTAPHSNFKQICKLYSENKSENLLFSGGFSTFNLPVGSKEDEAKLLFEHLVNDAADNIALRYGNNLKTVFLNF